MKMEKRAEAQRSRYPKPTPLTLGPGLPSRGSHTRGSPGLPEFRGPESGIPEGFGSASPTELIPAEADGEDEGCSQLQMWGSQLRNPLASVRAPPRNQECQEGDPGRVTQWLFEPPVRPTRNGWLGTTLSPSKEGDSRPLLVDRDPGRVSKGPLSTKIHGSAHCPPSGMSPPGVKPWPLH